jgi:SAM-dependent methyltransferase
MTLALDRLAAGLRDVRVRLILTSASILFLELLLIRWIPSEVRYIGFFSNLLLMASFLGIGIGILLGRRRNVDAMTPVPYLLFAVVWLTTSLQLNVQIRSDDEVFFGLRESSEADLNFLALPIAFALVAALMASVALPLGPLLRSMPPLRAYALDIAGSLLGIAAFVALSAAATPPVVWFSVVAVLILLLAGGAGLSLRWVPGVVVLGGVLAMSVADANQVWSPYYRIDVVETGSRTVLKVNGIPHQALHPVVGFKEPFYDQLYAWFPGRTWERVLVVGAGSGSDTAIALARGSASVDAVEIDPVIARLGEELHPDRPYQDPRVRRFEDDGRAFLRGNERRYDLVIFALPDSLTLVSSTANLRLESFLFTTEAFASVRDHLTPNGIFVLYNYYREPWLIAKIAGMLEEAFGHQPIVRLFSSNMAILASGPAVAALGGGPPPGERVDPIPATSGPLPSLATDDWPFLYLKTPFIAPHYLLALAFVLGIAALGIGAAARAGNARPRQFSPHFFVLGAAFLLLETRSLVSFSLLFGSTWLVNALAFFAILASVLLAILVNARLRFRHPGRLYAVLFAAIGLAWLIPPESLLIEPPVLRYTAAAALAFAPVFVANLVFTYSFRDTRRADMAFASNLLGAMAGGALEYVALLTGYRALLLVVALLYAVAWLFATRVRWLSDAELETEHPDRPWPAVEVEASAG